MSSVFDDLLSLNDDLEKYTKGIQDKAVEKIDLRYGLYFGEDSRVWMFPLVRHIEKTIIEDNTRTYRYPPFFGYDLFTRTVTKFLLGPAKDVEQIFGIQTPGGTGALALGLAFLTFVLHRSVAYSSEPGWKIYDDLFEKNGFQDIRKYRYWHAENRCLDFDGMYEDLSNAPENSVIILQSSAHNPTGCDLSKEQWKKISKIMKVRNLFPFFDCAYLGLASGSVEEDAWPIRYFADEGHEFFCALSFSKNFAIYGLRVGSLVVVMKHEKKLAAVKSHFLWLVRTSYLMPPCYGADILVKILTTPEYFYKWKESVRARYERLARLRKTLKERMEENIQSQQGFWNNITDQVGFFSMTGLSGDAMKILREKYHVYISDDGRINVPSLNATNMDHFVNAVVGTLREVNKNQSCTT